MTFEEAVFGVEKEVSYNREATCETCSGTGAKPGTSPVTCSRCHGQGVINVDTQTPLGMMRRQVTCDVCHGTGKEIKDPCPTCHGSGHEKKSHKVSVKIPAGVETGQQIRLQGQGKLALTVDLMVTSLSSLKSYQARNLNVTAQPSITA